MSPLPVPSPEMTDDSSSKESSSNNQMPLSLLPDDKLDATTVDVEKGLVGGTTTRDGKYLRWARITKEVEIKDGNG